MKTTNVSIPLALGLALALVADVGCVATPDSTGDTAETAPTSTAAAALPGSVAARLEQASRRVDVGDGAKVVGELGALRSDPASTPEQRDAASLSLARALEAKGDTAGAIKMLSELLVAHGNDRSWTLQKGTESALRRLLTGSDAAPPRPTPRENEPVAPFAHVLGKYFTEDHGTTHVVIQQFGGPGRGSDRIGTFNVSRAMREDKEAVCPLCDTNMTIWTSQSRTDDWLGIIRAGDEKAHAVVVYYIALGDRHIPAHFDPELPMSVAEVDAHLNRGEGIIVAKERPGAPPAILIGAPRSAQLNEVEEALAQMKTLPLEPVTVQVSDHLRPDEIEDVVKGSRAAQRACYAALLERAPGAEGSIKLKLAVEANGTVGEVSSEPSAAVKDADFVACMEGVAEKLVFPATGHSGKIVFPVRLASSK
jgi:hypothetical protein